MSEPKVYDSSSWTKRSSDGSSSSSATTYPRVSIEFCDSWGFKPRFIEAKTYLEKSFPGIVCSERARSGPEVSGNFDIFVGDQLVHSKLSGDGWFDTQTKQQKVHAAVRNATTTATSINQKSDIEAIQINENVVFDLEDENDSENGEEEEGNASLIVSLMTLVLSIPALIGAWCWPALVIGLVSGTVSSYARTLGHWLSLGVTALMMLVLNWFMWRSLKLRYIPMNGGDGVLGRKCKMYGPVLLTGLATPLILADLSRHVLGDLNVWSWCGDPSVQGGRFGRVNESWTDACFWSSTEYVCNIPCCVPGNNTVESTNDLSMNYYLQTNEDGSNFQLSFAENCGMGGIGKTIHNAPHTNPNCTCAGGKCDQSKSPSDQMFLYTTKDTLGLLALLNPTEKQDGNYPEGFGPMSDTTTDEDAFLPPHWPSYPQLSIETLKYVKAQAVIGNVGVPPAEIPDCNCDNCLPPDQENIHHLSFIGVLFTICFTYTGFVLLACGTLWNADIFKKLAEIKIKWQKLRARSSKTDDKTRPLLQGNESKINGGDMI